MSGDRALKWQPPRFGFSLTDEETHFCTVTIGSQTSPRVLPDISQLCCSPELALLIHLFKGLMINCQFGLLILELIENMEWLGVPKEIV